MFWAFMVQILDAMNQDSGIPLTQLQVDGGMTSNRLLMQLQADILCIPVGEASPDSLNRCQTGSLAVFPLKMF